MGSERGKGRGKETKEQCIRQQLTENADGDGRRSERQKGRQRDG